LGKIVEEGTAVRADLGSFSLAGKTGTARRTVHGRYAAGQHIPTFVGLFPGDHPQFVILVKLDNPRGAYVGGLTAAPVTKTVLQAALASRNATRFRLAKAYAVGGLGYLFGLVASTLFDLPTGAIIVWAMAIVGIVFSCLERAEARPAT